jgi:hypothetical protein
LVFPPLPDLDTLGEYFSHQIPSIYNHNIYPTHKEFHLCDYSQTKEKIEEGLR